MSTPDRGSAHPRRRQRLDEAQRREQIIACCFQVVAEHGYQQASLALIAEAAGVSKGLIWHYYTDRDTLMEQAAVTTVAQLRNQVGADIDLTAPVPVVLDAAIHRAADPGRTHPVQLRALSQIVQNLRDPDGTLHFDLTYYEETYQAQEQLFRRGQAEDRCASSIPVSWPSRTRALSTRCSDTWNHTPTPTCAHTPTPSAVCSPLPSRPTA